MSKAVDMCQARFDKDLQQLESELSDVSSDQKKSGTLNFKCATLCMARARTIYSHWSLDSSRIPINSWIAGLKFADRSHKVAQMKEEATYQSLAKTISSAAHSAVTTTTVKIDPVTMQAIQRKGIDYYA